MRKPRPVVPHPAHDRRRRLSVASALILAACAGSPATESLPTSLAFSASDNVPTVGTAVWDVGIEGVDSSWVEFGEDGAFDLSTPAVVGGQGEKIMLGMSSDRDFDYRVAAVVGDTVRYSQAQTLSTGTGLPSELPDLTVDAPTGELGGYLLHSVLATGESFPVITNGAGEYIWWWKRPETDWEDTKVPRVYMGRDGESVVYMAVSALVGGDGTIVRVSFDGEELAALPVPAAHHDFVELPDGKFAVLTEAVQEIDGNQVSGDLLIEVDVDGAITPIWNAFDDLAYDPATVMDDGTGWTHANALDYDDDEDCYYVSLRNFGGIYKLSRDGELLWVFGGEASDFATADGSTDLMNRQHQFEVFDEGVVVFSNNDPSKGYSEVLEYAVDWETGLAEQTWGYRHDPDLYTLGFGAVERLPSGDKLVTWTTSGLAELVDQDGQVTWSAQAALGGGLTYMQWTPDLYAFPEN